MHSNTSRIIAVAALLRVTALPSQVQESMFRGNAQHTGEYPASGAQLVGLAWRVQTSGDVTSSPTVADGTAYVGSGDGSLYAIVVRSGQVRWRESLGAAVSGSPAVSRGLVFATTRRGDIVGVDAKSGAVRWRFATKAPMPMPWGYESGDYFESSPAVTEGLVIFGSRDGHVYALDQSSGQRRWTAETTGQLWSSPAIASGRVYIGSADGYVYCVSLRDGSRRWRFATTGASLESSQFGFDRRTVESSPAVVNGIVYIGARDGFLYAIDADSGTLRWRFDHKTSWVVTSPAVANGVVYAGSSDNAFVQALDAKTGAELWRTRTGGIVWSSPALSGQTVYVGDGIGRLHALDARTGTERWLFRTGESVHSSPVVNDSLVIFGSADGGVYALRTTDGAATARGVFFDSTLSKATSTDDAALIMRYLRNRGYAVLDQAGLDAFLGAHKAGRSKSVVVFATDVIRHPENLRSYLDGGGTVVWPGIPPGIWPRDSATGARRGYGSIDRDAPRRITGVDHSSSSFDEHSARPTAAGIAFGMTRHRGAWGVDPRSVTSVLALDDWGNATSWVKQFIDKPGTGFIRVPAANLLAIYLLAEKEGG